MTTSINNIASTSFEADADRLQQGRQKEIKALGKDEIRKAIINPEVHIAKLGVSNDKPETQKIDYTDLAEKLSSFIEQDNLSMEFSMDKASNKMVMKLVDNDTKEVVQQYPPEIMLKIARMLAQSAETGQVANAKV
jgi:uncharacterized FlaG/YvyC family protein